MLCNSESASEKVNQFPGICNLFPNSGNRVGKRRPVSECDTASKIRVGVSKWSFQNAISVLSESSEVAALSESVVSEFDSNSASANCVCFEVTVMPTPKIQHQRSEEHIRLGDLSVAF